MVNVSIFFFLISNTVQTQSHPEASANRTDGTGAALEEDSEQTSQKRAISTTWITSPSLPSKSKSSFFPKFPIVRPYMGSNQYSMFSMFTPSELLTHYVETACPFICLVHLSGSKVWFTHCYASRAQHRRAALRSRHSIYTR